MNKTRLEAFSDAVIAIIMTIMVLYIAAIPLAFVEYHISHALYVIVALIWLVPDRRIESKINK